MTRRLESRASFTAQSCAAQRAAESLRAPGRRLLDDPYSRHFVHDPLLRAWLIHPVLARVFIGVLNYVFGAAAHLFTVLRVRYTDEVVDLALSDGVDQIVLLGAGFDTTILRRAPLHAVRIFEVDAPTTQADKRSVAERLGCGDDPEHIVWVSCDFERDVLRDRLFVHGFDPTQRSLIVWLGVTVYLTQPAIEATLGELAAVCAPGSLLVFDYVDLDVVSGGKAPARALRWAGSARRRGEPFLTGFTAAGADAALASHGFQCREHLRAVELLRRYAPTDARQSRLDGRLAITTAQRT